MSENNVKKFREEKAWTIVDLAKKAGLTPQTVSKIEKGLQTRRTSWLKVALALEKKPEDVFSTFEN